MLRLLFLVFLASAVPFSAQGQHAGIFISQDDALAIREAQGRYALLDEAIALAKETMEVAFAHPMEVPNPGEAGGYEHERHKQNYREMRYAGLLYSITGEDKYAAFVRDMLDMYAILYPTLGPHPLAHHQKPGKIFHQTLNEEVWLVHTSIAYDCVYDWLSEEERTRFETNIFRPMADWFHIRNKTEFDRIHNHGTWGCGCSWNDCLCDGGPSTCRKVLTRLGTWMAKVAFWHNLTYCSPQTGITWKDHTISAML